MKSSKFPATPVHEDETLDEFMDGRLKLIQSRSGYRFSIDAVLLSDFVSIKRDDRIVDLGTGCGVIPLVLLLTRPVGFAVGLEIQDHLADQATRNARLNGFEGRMGVIRGDIRYPPLSPSTVDVVTCNPPYRRLTSGRINPDRQRAIARHEIMASLGDILDTTKQLLRPKGRLAMIYPGTRLVDLLVRMRGVELEPKRMQVVYPGNQSEAKLVLVESVLGGKPGLRVEPPLMDQGAFSIRALT